jgi:two-component system response regulator NreC
MSKLRILIADDHEAVREGLKSILNSQADMEVVAEVRDGAAAVQQTQALHPDLVVMDISIPSLNGFKATETLKASCPSVKILALTRHSDEAYLQQMLRAGAAAYVLKQSRATELLQAIRAVAAGGQYLDPAIAGTVMGDFGRRGQPAASRVAKARLSTREEEVMRLIAWGHSNKEIASQLDLSVKTVETHKAKAMQKLSLRGRVDIVRYALLQGWLHDS